MKDTKENLFRLMEVVAFLPEIDDDLTGDVENLTNLVSPAQKNAARRINSQREFNEAFELWFDSLGFDNDLKKNKIKISTVIAHITDVLEKRGIKY